MAIEGADWLVTGGKVFRFGLVPCQDNCHNLVGLIGFRWNQEVSEEKLDLNAYGADSWQLFMLEPPVSGYISR